MKTKPLWILLILLTISMSLNLNLILTKFNAPTDKLGTLNESIEVVIFGTQDFLFRLPKGLIVENASPRGFARIGQFEPYRFAIYVTSNRSDLVDYSESSQDREFGPLYSADK